MTDYADLFRALDDLPVSTGEDWIAEMDAELGRLFARSVKSLLRTTRTPARRIRAIGSHGQTVFHMPEGPNRSSLQIGDPNVIARETGIATVADFRRMDMAAGGQGRDHAGNLIGLHAERAVQAP